MLLFFVLARGPAAVGIASFCLLLTVLAWPVQTEMQRIYSPYQLLEKMSKADGLMNILSGGSYYQKVFNLSEAMRGHEPAEDNMSAPITSFRSTSGKGRSASRSSAPAAATTWRRRCAWAHPMSTPSRSIRRSSSSAAPTTPSILTTIHA